MVKDHPAKVVSLLNWVLVVLDEPQAKAVSRLDWVLAVVKEHPAKVVSRLNWVYWWTWKSHKPR